MGAATVANCVGARLSKYDVARHYAHRADGYLRVEQSQKRNREGLTDLSEVHRELGINVSVVPEDAGASVGGLVIIATKFSQQLGRLQSSIRRANAPVVTPAPLLAEANATEHEGVRE
jgi:hypothetical protein